MSVQRLFNSRGQHIANFSNGQLHSPSGENIGHFLESYGVFIDMKGRYLGEIVGGNRFLYNNLSPHRSMNYGNYGNYGNIGNYGNPGNIGIGGMPSGFQEVTLSW